MMFLVFKENSFAASTIKVEAEQPVISTGLYRLVRHPMYSAGVILFVGTPLALGSAWGLIVAIPLCAVMIARLLDDDDSLPPHFPVMTDSASRSHIDLLPFCDEHGATFGL